MAKLEGLDAKISGKYRTRSDAINKCFMVARKRGCKIFALFEQGMCLASNDLNTYKYHGKSKWCKNSKGSFRAKDVYLILRPTFVQKSKLSFAHILTNLLIPFSIELEDRGTCFLPIIFFLINYSIFVLRTVSS